MAYHQLIKQGINKDKITIDFIQYGDEESEMLKKVSTNNKQASVVLDFSALPRKNLYEELKRLTAYKYKDYEFNKKFFEFMKKAVKGNKENKIGFIKFLKSNFDFPDNTNLDDFYKAFKQFDGSLLEKKQEFNKEDYSVSLASPDFVSDHHYDDKGKLVKGKSGAINKTNFKSDTEHLAVSFAPGIADYSTIKEVSKIDSAQFSNILYNLELPKEFKEKGRMERLSIITKTLIEDIMKSNKTLVIEILKNSSPSMVSLYNNALKYKKFSDMQMKIFGEFEKEKPNWDKIDNLRKALPENLKADTSKEKVSKLRGLKTREGWIKYAEENRRRTQTGYLTPKKKEEMQADLEEKTDTANLHLRSLSNYLLDFEKTLIKLKSENSNKEKIDSIKKEIENTKQKIKEKKEEIKKLKDDFEKYVESKEGKISKVGNIARQDVSDYKHMPSRYLGSVMIFKGERLPFQLRRFSGMIQVALSPDAPKELKEKVDLAEISAKVLKEVRQKYETPTNKWAFEKIIEGSGGHKGITTISNLNMLGLLNKKFRERLKELEALQSRAYKVNTSLAKISKVAKNPESSKWVELNQLRRSKQEAAKNRTAIMNEIEKQFYKELWKFKDYKVTKKLDNPEKYTMPDIEESLQKFKQELL